jgi:hypothetical protein
VRLHCMEWYSLTASSAKVTEIQCQRQGQMSAVKSSVVLLLSCCVVKSHSNIEEQSAPTTVQCSAMRYEQLGCKERSNLHFRLHPVSVRGCAVRSPAAPC